MIDGPVSQKTDILNFKEKKKRQWKEMLLKSQQISLSKATQKVPQDALCEVAQEGFT